MNNIAFEHEGGKHRRFQRSSLGRLVGKRDARRERWEGCFPPQGAMPSTQNISVVVISKLRISMTSGANYDFCVRFMESHKKHEIPNY